MKRTILMGTAALAACTSKPNPGCPAIEQLTTRNAAADARAALAKGDHRLLMLGGFVGTIPGVPEAGNQPTRMIEGTSDMTTEECRRERSAAEAYARKYNEAIVGG